MKIPSMRERETTRPCWMLARVYSRVCGWSVRKVSTSCSFFNRVLKAVRVLGRAMSVVPAGEW